MLRRHRRLEEKRRRRERRLERRFEERPAAEAPSGDVDETSDGLLAKFARAISSLGARPPDTWPGASDSSIARPDMVKLRLADFAMHQPPGKRKYRQLESDARRGPAGGLPDMEHWVMEEFVWHGAPGDPWNPIEAYLAREGHGFSPAAREQLRLWKDARLGAFEIGRVDEDTVALREWSFEDRRAVGETFRAIGLNLGGAGAFQKLRGYVTVSYLAPWCRDPEIRCLMGYGISVPPRDADGCRVLLALRDPAACLRPWPWRSAATDSARYHAEWDRRDWRGWISDRLEFPFEAKVPTPPDGSPGLAIAVRMSPMWAAQSRERGVYIDCIVDRRPIVSGATGVYPLDVLSANSAALEEYRAYRARVGPPAGNRGVPTFQEVSMDDAWPSPPTDTRELRPT